MTFEFVDDIPPAGKACQEIYREFTEALRAHPGQWAVYPRRLSSPSVASSTANAIRSGRVKAFAPAGQFEAAARKETVYVRYVDGAQ